MYKSLKVKQHWSECHLLLSKNLSQVPKTLLNSLCQTHHFEVLCSALCAVKVTGQQHVVDVVARAVIKFPHVEGPGLKIVKVSFDF